VSPTRRDILKLSAGAVAATFAAPSIAAADPLPELFTAPSAPLMGEIRTTTTLALFASTRTLIEFPFDGDIDGTWTLHARPYWSMKAMTDEMDFEGIYHCTDLTANQLMEVMWHHVHDERPKVLSAELITDNDRVLDDLGAHRHDWYDALTSTYRHWVVTVDALNDWENHPWSLVIWNHRALEHYPGANAIIECQGYFYTAVIDKAAWPL
jgi:hypothetical protein